MSIHLHHNSTEASVKTFIISAEIEEREEEVAREVEMRKPL